MWLAIELRGEAPLGPFGAWQRRLGTLRRAVTSPLRIDFTTDWGVEGCWINIHSPLCHAPLRLREYYCNRISRAGE